MKAFWIRLRIASGAGALLLGIGGLSALTGQEERDRTVPPLRFEGGYPDYYWVGGAQRPAHPSPRGPGGRPDSVRESAP